MDDPWPAVVAEFLTTGPIGLLTVSEDGRIAHANEVACEILGRDVNGLILYDLIHPDDLARFVAGTMARGGETSGRRGRGSVWRMLLPDASIIEILAHMAMVTVAGVRYGQIGFLPAPPRLAVLKSLEDVAAARPLSTIFTTLMDGIATAENSVAINWVDLDGRTHLFGNLTPILGGVGGQGERDTDRSTPWFQAATHGTVARIEDLDGLRADVADAARAAGHRACCVSPIRDPATGQQLLYVNWVKHPSHLDYVQQTFADVLHDVVQVALDRAEDSRQLHHAAHHDQLTGLANRRAFFDGLTAALAAGPLSVLYLDLDGFKPVNERFGHAAGDAVLVAVADRLRVCMPAEALLARLGGDEFVIVVPRDDGTVAQALAERLVHEARQPIVLEAHGDISVGVSVGFSVTDGSTPTAPEALILAADEAL